MLSSMDFRDKESNDEIQAPSWRGRKAADK